MPELRAAWLAAGLCLLLSACSGSGAPQQGGRAPEKAEFHLVETARVEVSALARQEVYTGSLRARRVLRVYNQEPGKIIDLPFYEGAQVAQGARLAQLDDALLQAQLARAEATLQQARSEAQRMRKLSDKKLIAEDEWVRAQTAQAVAEAELRLLRVRLGYMQIHAPFAGVVGARLAEPGDAVPANTHLLTLFDPASLVAEIRVSEQIFSRLRVGDPAAVRIDALGETPFPGTLLRLHPDIDAQTRQGTVEIAFPEVPAGARGGQFCRVVLRSVEQSRPNLPASALRRDRDGEYVFAVEDDQTVRRAPVRGGAQLAERVEILEGVRAGQTVVSKGFLGLQAGMRVEPIAPAAEQ